MSILLRASSPLRYVVSWSGRVHHCVNLDDAAKAHVHPKILDIFVATINGYSIKSLLCRTSHPFHFSQPKAKSLALLASRRALTLPVRFCLALAFLLLMKVLMVSLVYSLICVTHQSRIQNGQRSSLLHAKASIRLHSLFSFSNPGFRPYPP